MFEKTQVFEKYDKIWWNGKPGLYMNLVGNLCKVLVFDNGCWLEKFVEASQLSERTVDISKIIYAHRIQTIQFERID